MAMRLVLLFFVVCLSLPAAMACAADDEPNPKITAQLEKLTVIAFRQMPLKDVTRYLSDQHGIAFELDPSVPVPALVTIEIRKVKLKDGLKSMLDPHGLEYVAMKDKIVFRAKMPAKE